MLTTYQIKSSYYTWQTVIREEHDSYKVTYKVDLAWQGAIGGYGADSS